MHLTLALRYFAYMDVNVLKGIRYLKKKKGSIRWSKTFDARKAFLNQCSTADPAAISKIMSKFGRVRG